MLTDPDDRVIAGVCSGLAAYINIDALWVRLGFAALTIFTSGFGIILYIIMALVVPDAKTTSQKLEMKGEPVNIETMSGAGPKKNSNQQGIPKESTVYKILSFPIVVLQKLFSLLKYLFPALRVIAGILIAIGSLAGIISISIFTPIVLTNSSVLFSFSLEEIISLPVLYMATLGLYITFIIPLVAIFIFGLGLITKKYAWNVKVATIAFVIWCIAIITGGVAIFNAIYRVDVYSQSNELYETSLQDIPLTINPTSVSVSNRIQLTYIQGTSTSLTISGRNELVDAFVYEEKVNGTTGQNTISLQIHDPEFFCMFCNEGSLEAVLVAPSIQSIDAQIGSRVSTELWQSESPLSITAHNGSRGNFSIIAPEVIVSAENGSRIDLKAQASTTTIKSLHGSRVVLTGSTTEAFLTSEYGSKIDAQQALIDIVKAIARQGSQINLPNIETLDVEAKFGSSIRYEGEPTIVDDIDVSSNLNQN